MADVPAVEKGRGAWTSTGKDNGSRKYEYIAGKPLDGSNALKDVNYLAVNLGVRGIQHRVNRFAFSPPLTVDGVFGAKTRDAVKVYQSKRGLVADGIVGQATAYVLWFGLIGSASGTAQIRGDLLYGLMKAESGLDSGAVGFNTPTDRGLFQINLAAHPDVTAEMAHNPEFACKYAANRMAAAAVKYSGKGTRLQEYCMVAQHNSPAQALKWYQTGEPPSEQIKTYVDRVVSFANEY